MTIRAVVLSSLLALTAILMSGVPAWAGTILVTTTTDELVPNGQCSLREAIRNANANARVHPDCSGGDGNDQVVIPAGTYTLTLTGRSEDAARTGDLDLADLSGVVLAGAGAATTIVQAGSTPGAGIDRVFHVLDGAVAAIDGITIRHGRVTGANEGGGGLFVADDATLTLRRGVVAANTATELNGGGIRIDPGSVVEISDTTIGDNVALLFGGGIHVNGLSSQLRLTGVTLNSNRATSPSGVGGGLRNAGTAVLTNVTISGNTAGSSGGGISQVSTTLEVTHATIVGNGAPVGGGVAREGGTILLRGTVLAANALGGNCVLGAATPSSAGSNLSDDLSCAAALVAAGDVNNVDPRLGELRNNGGFTATHAPTPVSPVVDAVQGACPPPGTDQRGAPRPLDGNQDGIARCDIGAVELQRADLSLSKAASSTSPVVGERVTFTVTVTNGGPTASIARVVDSLPEGVELVSVTPEQGTCFLVTRTTICELGAIPASRSATVTTVVTTRVPGPITNQTTVFGGDVDPVPGNNAASVTVVVQVPLPAAQSTQQPAPEPPSKPRDNDDDLPKLTELEREQRRRTNRSGKDDYRTEGDVLAARLDERPPYVEIGMQDGIQRVVLLCGTRCPTIRPGDYLEAEGEKIHEALFEATDVSIERHR